MSLHWILLLTVTLLHCLTAAPITKDKEVNVKYDDIKDLIEELKEMGCSASDSAFYSLSGINNCAISALNCSIQELETYKSECENSTDDELVNTVNRLKESIEIIQKKSIQKESIQNKNSTNCTCEESEQKPYNEFLDNILTLLQMLNSQSK